MSNEKWKMVSSLPFTIRSGFGRDLARRTMHVGDSGSALSRVGIVDGNNTPVLIIGDRIFGNLAHVARADQIIQRLWQLALVCRVLIDQRAHLEQIVVQ